MEMPEPNCNTMCIWLLTKYPFAPLYVEKAEVEQTTMINMSGDLGPQKNSAVDHVCVADPQKVLPLNIQVTFFQSMICVCECTGVWKQQTHSSNPRISMVTWVQTTTTYSNCDEKAAFKHIKKAIKREK